MASGDSISTVSEACASGKKTIVFYPGLRSALFPSRNKHKRFLDRLSDQELISACDIKNVGQMVLDASRRKDFLRHNQDNVNVENALERIL